MVIMEFLSICRPSHYAFLDLYLQPVDVLSEIIEKIDMFIVVMYSRTCLAGGVMLVSHCGEYPCEWKTIYSRQIRQIVANIWRIYGEWAYECNSPPISNDRKVIAIRCKFARNDTIAQENY